MEFAQMEVTVLERVVNEVADKEFRDFADLKLAYIGGGIGEVIFA